MDKFSSKKIHIAKIIVKVYSGCQCKKLLVFKDKKVKYI